MKKILWFTFEYERDVRENGIETVTSTPIPVFADDVTEQEEEDHDDGV